MINGSYDNQSNGDILSQNQQKGWWTIGLINGQHKYMTAETFGFKVSTKLLHILLHQQSQLT